MSLLIAPDVIWNPVAHVCVSVAIEELPCQWFSHRISGVIMGTNLLELQQVLFHPIKESEVLDIHVASASCGLLSIRHEECPCVIFI